MIGLDFLAAQNSRIDYRHQKLVFASMDDAERAVAFETKHEAGGTYIVIPLEIDGEKFRVLLDTGTRDSMLFEPRLRGNLRQLRVRAWDFNFNAGGQDRLAEVELQSVWLGVVCHEKQKAYIWSMPEDNLRDFDGLLGPATVGATIVAFDFDRHLVLIKTR